VAVPSRWPENFPYAVLEAQMAGRAVVASGVGGIPEQITDGVDGLLVPPAVPSALAGRIEALFREPAVATRIGTAARARVLAERGMGPFLDSMESIYRSVR
jgi:glycosyltransferase involved in cell wall biosynthesis